jgi:MFS family permease
MASAGWAGLMALAALVIGRVSVPFQFQSVTPLLPALDQVFPVTPTGFGVLLGLYMSPGVAMAVVAPVLMKRLGRAATLYLAFGLMALGQCGLLLAPSLEYAYAARFLAGIGGCIVYIATVDLAAQLENAGPLAGRMGAIAASWPFGNAMALVLLGVLVSPGNYAVAGLVPLAGVLAAAALIGTMLGSDNHDPHKRTHRPAEGISFAAWRRSLLRALPVAGSFALYNVGFILLTSFSPQLLAAQGYSQSAASAVSSLPMWLFILSVPGGGLLAGRSPARDRLLVALGCLGSALCILLSQALADKAIWYVLAGILGGLPTAPMLAEVGRREPLTKGTTVAYPALFLVFFIALLVLPPVLGVLVDWTGNIRVAAGFCIVILSAAFLLFASKERYARAWKNV